MGKKRLYKVREGKKVSGVCGGVAEYFNLDPSIVRILWVVLAFMYFIGIVLYIACAIVLPTKDEVSSSEDRENDGNERRE